LKLLKADFHIHTSHSFDCDTSPEDIIGRCLETGISCIAVADHGTAEGGLITQSLAPFPVIVAEEILTPDGEIMGMFLKETIPTRIPIEQAIARIREQEALVCLPHPFDPFRGIKLNSAQLDDLAGQIDVIEVFNARSPFSRTFTKARAFTQKHGIPEIAGSDAHVAGEIGDTYVEMPEFNGKDDFLEALKESTIHQHQASPLVHLNSTWVKLKRLL